MCKRLHVVGTPPHGLTRALPLPYTVYMECTPTPPAPDAALYPGTPPQYGRIRRAYRTLRSVLVACLLALLVVSMLNASTAPAPGATHPRDCAPVPGELFMPCADISQGLLTVLY